MGANGPNGVSAEISSSSKILPGASVATSANWITDGGILVGGGAGQSRLFLQNNARIGGPVYVGASGYLEGGGDVSINVDVKAGGEVDPGDTRTANFVGDIQGVGTLNVGAIDFESGSKLTVDIGGVADRIRSSNQITLGGTLNIREAFGWTPTPNTPYYIMDYLGVTPNSIAGSFANIVGKQAGNGLIWTCNIEGNEVALRALRLAASTTTPLPFVTNTPSPTYNVGSIDGLPSTLATTITASVDWGDGQASTLANGDLTQIGASKLEVDASNTYGGKGLVADYAIRTTFYSDGSLLGTVDSLAQVGLPPVQNFDFGVPLNIQNVRDDSTLATFDYQSNGLILYATIAWGDGETTQGLIRYQGGDTYGISGNEMHYYASPGTYNATITLKLPDGTTCPPVNGQIVSQSNPNPPPPPEAISGLVADTGLTATLDGYLGAGGNGMELATMSEVPGLDYLARVTWETIDGTQRVTSADTYDEGAYISISANYDFLTTGVKSAVVTVMGDDAVVASVNVPITVSNTITVTPLPVVVDEDVNGDYLEVAKFTDSDSAAVSADYAVSMAGISTSDAFVVPDLAGGFDVYAQFDSAYTGSTDAITTTVSRIDDASSATGTAANAIAFASGSDDVFDELPPGGLEITNGTTLDLDGNSMTVGALSLDGSIINGSITADSLTATDGYISAALTTSSTTVSADGGLLIGGSGTSSLGTTAIEAGATLTIGEGSGATVATGSLSVASSGSLNVTAGDTLNVAAGVTNNGTIQIDGTASVAGTLENDNVATNNGQLTVARFDGDLVNTATVTLNGTSDYTWDGAISGSGGTVIKLGANTVTLSGTNTSTAATVAVQEGNLHVTTADAIAEGSSLSVGDDLAEFDASDLGGAYRGGESDFRSRGGHSSGTYQSSTDLPPDSPIAQVEDSGLKTLAVIADTLDSSHAQSPNDMLNAATMMANFVFADVAINGGVRSNSSEVLNSAITQVLTANNMTVTAASGTPNYVQAEAAAYIADITAYLSQAYAIAFDLTLLQYFVEYDVTPNA